MSKQFSSSGFTLVEMLISVLILSIIMGITTLFFINFINTQIKSIGYLGIVEENMLDMQYLREKIRQAEDLRILESDKLEYDFLILKNSHYNTGIGPYSIIKAIDERNGESDKKKVLGVKDFFLFNGVDVDNSGNLYYADTGNHVIRKINLLTLDNQIIAGVFQEEGRDTEEGALAKETHLSSPMGVKVDSRGVVYFTDSGNHLIRKIGNDGRIYTVAGVNGRDIIEEERFGFRQDDTDAIGARLNFPTDIEISSDGTIYFADTFNNRIRKINDLTHEISTIAGNGEEGYILPASMKAVDAPLFKPTGIALDGNGNIYFTDAFNSRIMKIDAETNDIEVVSGNMERGFSGDEGNPKYAQLNMPSDIEFYDGDIYFSDSLNYAVRKIDSGKDGILGGDDDFITTVVGYTGKLFYHPGKDLISSDDDIYITTVNPYPGDSPENGGAPASSSVVQINTPTGIAFTSEGDLVFADSMNNRLKFVASSSSQINIRGGLQKKEGYIYILPLSSGNIGLNYFKNFDFSSLRFEEITDYIGKAEIKKMKFFTSRYRNSPAHPSATVEMVITYTDPRDLSSVDMSVTNTVSLRKYRE